MDTVKTKNWPKELPRKLVSESGMHGAAFFCTGRGGTFIVLFFVTQEAGRVSQQDATTMRLVLEAAPEIGSNYGIIVNKVHGVKFEFGKFLLKSCV